MTDRRGRRVAIRAALGVFALTLGITSIGWAIGPGRTIDTARFVGGSYQVLRYEGGRIGSTTTLAPDSPGAAILERWLREHDSGWKMDWNSYAHFRYVRGERFTLNFASDYAVLNYQWGANPGQWAQVWRPINPKDVPDLFGPAPKR